MNDEAALREAAEQQGYSTEAAQRLLRSLHDRLGSDLFYVYRTGGGAGGGSGAPSARRRTLLAFPSGDAALAFAQRNRLATTPRLLRLSLARVLAVLLAHANIEAVVFANDVRDDLPAGHLPDGTRFERAALLADLEKEF